MPFDPEARTIAGDGAPERDSGLALARDQRIGAFTLVEPLGEGGFGAVWKARQHEPVRRDVALKVIKPGMDSAAVLARFDAERQALAVMDHPGIARVYDGGVTERGLPYFVMEMVAGEPITEFCDRQRLGLIARIELFIAVCEAVQHAHMKGVVHRDLKPANVLVGAGESGPSARVIDFGIAKALETPLTEQTLMTEHGQLIGTPEYMSPEQALGSALDVDTRADVYSLGVMLYELLTGTLPFGSEQLRGEGLAEMQRIIREDEPPRPSTRIDTVVSSAEGPAGTPDRTSIDVRTLSASLKRDLDWIVMRCIEKDRERRYDTPGDIAEELRRFLNHEPVLAGPPSAGYRLGKFVRRNRVGVTAGALVAAALVLAVAGTTWGMLWALSERDRAEEAEGVAEARLADLEIVSEFQSSQLSEIDAAAMGEGIRDDLLAEIEAAIGADPDAATRLELFAELLGEANFTDIALGAIDTHVFDRALEAIETDFADRPLIEARLLQTVADTLKTLGLLQRAMGPQERAIEIRRRELGDEHPDTITSISHMGALMHARNDLPEAERYIGEELALRRKVFGNGHPSTLISVNHMGALLHAQGRLADSEPYFREVLDTGRELFGDDDPRTLASLTNYGALLMAQSKAAEAEPYCREAAERARRVRGEDHPETLMAVNNHGRVLVALERLDEAERMLRDGLERCRRALGDGHPTTFICVYNLSLALLALDRPSEAEPLGLEFAEQVDAVLGAGHPYAARAAEHLAEVYDALHEAEPEAGHDAEAATWRAKLPETDG